MDVDFGIFDSSSLYIVVVGTRDALIFTSDGAGINTGL